MLPSTLTDAYDQIINRMQGRDKKVALRTMFWILKAGQPLRMDELRELLAVRDTDTRLHSDYLYEPSYILKVCQSLVLYDNQSGDIVRFVHFSVQEFLENLSISKDKNPGFPPVSSLVITCLKYITFDDFKNWENWEGKNVRDALKTHKALNYVACYWDFHGRQAEEAITEFQGSNAHEALLAFLGSQEKRAWAFYILSIHAGSGYPYGFSHSDLTALHVIAKGGLVKTCRLLLDECRSNMTYSPIRC
jgi:hypothetical protein